MRYIRFVWLNLLLVVSAIIISGCSLQKPAKSTTKIQAVATTNFYGELEQAVLKDHGQVYSIIDSANVDPHEYDLTIKPTQKIKDSDLVLSNGVGYDTWVTKVTSKRHITVGEDIAHISPGANEHLWYRPDLMKKVTLKLAAEFSQIQPQHRAAFYANAKAYNQQLSQLTDLLATIKRHNQGGKVAVSEPVFDYALATMGYKVINQHFAQAIEEGTDPSYDDIAQLQADIRHHRIAFFVENTQSDAPVINQLVKLCHQYHVPVVQVTETVPAGKNYLSWMKDEFMQVRNIQKGID